jgi:hypothetical protein
MNTAAYETTLNSTPSTPITKAARESLRAFVA